MILNKKLISQVAGSIVLVVLTFYITILFHGKQVAPDYKQRLADKDSVLASIRRELNTERAAKDLAIQQLQEKDSLLQIRYNNNTKIIYEKIPVYIRSLNKDSLRAAVQHF